jgi:hypothetical protein
MGAVIFDSLRLEKRLRQSGLSEAQAETYVDAMRDALSEVATKQDLEILAQTLYVKLGAAIIAAGAVGGGVFGYIVKGGA